MIGILPNHLRTLVIRPILKSLNLWSPAAENLLMGTAAQESAMGHSLKQQNNGTALGIYQIEPATHQDIFDNFLAYRHLLLNKVLYHCSAHGQVNESNQDAELIGNVNYATCIARLVYARISSPLPDANDVKGLAAYWKAHYNTPKGKGTEKAFIDNYERFCGDSGSQGLNRITNA